MNLLTQFTKLVTHWYSINKRDLPWRKTTNPYHIWLSEIILQQTQVIQGLPYYEAFIATYPSVFHLAKAKEQAVLKLWQGLGYYSRARNLHTTAIHIANNLQGEFPTTYKELLQLKGVGDYTASAIASICFNETQAVVDGNVYRVLARFFGIKTPINSLEGKKEFKELAQTLLDKNNPADYNQAIMEFGAMQCKPNNPLCHKCPLSENCIALNENKINTLPVKTKMLKAKTKYFNYLVFVSHDEKTILEKRQGKGIWQNLYQFPLIETKQPTNLQRFKKQLENHSLLKNTSFELYLYNTKPIVHKLSHQHLYTNFWIINLEKLAAEGVLINTIHQFPVPVLIENFIESFNF